MRYLSLILLVPFAGLFASESIPVKVVVLAMYENGEAVGDERGELQTWVERSHYDQKFEFPMGVRDIYYRRDGLLITMTGGGVTNATATVTALGMDERFDFSQAYWVIAGIAGADPADCGLGSAAWAKWVVDGDLAKEIDPREAPEDWPYGYIALGAKKPKEAAEVMWMKDVRAFELDAGLVEWAYAITKDVELMDHPELEEFRELFTYENARKPPFVMIGDSLGSSTYWHGFRLNEWANDWLKMHSRDEGNFVMTNMEDNGTLTALNRLSEAGYVDADRVLVLRTASNFSQPPQGKDVAWSTTAPYPAEGLPAKENAYRVANKVVEALIAGWGRYAEELPR
ncbi:MAG: purine nucleoside permease [Verrucomicrobiota bacterium]